MGRARISVRQLTRAAVLLAALVALVVSISSGIAGEIPGTVLDDFGDNSLDLSIWTPITSGGASTAVEANQRIEFTHSVARDDRSAYAALLGQCPIMGDFDIQIDFELVNWPANNAQRLSLVASPLFWMERVYADQDYYMASLGAGSVLVPTSDMTGKLRLQRIGSTVTASYFSNGDWELAATRNGVATADVTFNISSGIDSGNQTPQLIVATADNAVVNSGTFACYINGDLDCNGHIGHFDALDAALAAAGTPFPHDDCPDIGSSIGQPASVPSGPNIFGDVDCGGTADVLDLLPILRFAAQLPTGLPPTCTPVGEYIELGA